MLAKEAGMRVVKVGLLVVLAAAASVLAWFCWDNLDHYWEANHPPAGAEMRSVFVTGVDVDHFCGHTSTSTSTCVDEVDGIRFADGAGRTQRADAHRGVSPGDTVDAFQDSDGDWQVRGAFGLGWVLRTAGLTGAGALVLAGIVVSQLGPGSGRASEGFGRGWSGSSDDCQGCSGPRCQTRSCNPTSMTTPAQFNSSSACTCTMWSARPKRRHQGPWGYDGRGRHCRSQSWPPSPGPLAGQGVLTVVRGCSG